MDRSTKPSFNFVNLQHPDDLKNEETQLRIRRLAMTEVGKARRKPKTKRARHEIVLEFRKPSEQSHTHVDRFGGGQLDPFGPYPVELDDSERALLANVLTTEDNNHPTVLRGSWYPVGLSYIPAFYNMLANSQNFLFEKRHGYFPSQDDAVALRHHHKALRHTTEMMKDPKMHQSDELIGSMVSFMIHQISCGLQGDLLGSFFQDRSPAVPMPSQWLTDSKSPPNSPRPANAVSLSWKQQLPMQLDWITIFDDVVQLIWLDRMFNEKQLMLAITSGSWMEPTIYRLLSIRPLHKGNSREHVMEEVCRLGTLLFLSPFWRALGQSPVRTSAISRNLLLVLFENMIEWSELKPFLIWAIYFAAIETKDLAERSQFVLMLGILMSGMQLQEWDGLMNIVKGVLWVEKIFAGTDDLIREEVMQIVNHHRSNNARSDSVPTGILEAFAADVEEEHY
ncbi:hypothetical protein J3E74DRAFT_450616 [Bipolaris maydis]|nr:hypothetical protein J3E74DRAFT_450616 [Bipolaris maydis]